jgi:hypothetical protein
VSLSAVRRGLCIFGPVSLARGDVPIPEGAYTPEISNQTSHDQHLTAPWAWEAPGADPSAWLPGVTSPLPVCIDPERYVDQGDVPADALTSENKIRIGQVIETVNYQECQVAGGFSVLLEETGGCDVREVFWSCNDVKELWWVRPPKLFLCRHKNLVAGAAGHRRLLVCPDGTWCLLPGIRKNSTYDTNPATNTAGLPPLWFPPIEEPAVGLANYSAGSVIGPEPDTVDTTIFYWRTVYPMKVSNCTASYDQKLYQRVTRLNVRTGAETEVSNLPAQPPADRPLIYRIPNCGG